jgi:beta-lactamase superfamily II metal-dependent hydrolase
MNKGLVALQISIAFLTVSSFTFPHSPSKESSASSSEETEVTVSLKAHLLPLGAPGDCSYIKFGDTDILIDAGGIQGSAKAITDALTTYCTDKVLDYVIISHSDADHLVNFYSLDGVKGWLDKNGTSSYINTLIDFDFTQDKTITSKEFKDRDIFFDSADHYLPYSLARSSMKTTGKIKNYYPVSECCYKARGITNPIVEGAEADYTLTFGEKSTETATLHLLYNSFNNTRTTEGKSNEVERNNISVCSMVEYADQKLLFCGDLEEFGSSMTRVGAESALVKSNKSLLSSGVYFFKASHHASKTSNSLNLLDVIRPQYVWIPAVAGGKYDFPNQYALNNLLKWTDYVYMPEKNGDKGPETYYGQMDVSIAKDKNEVTYTNTTQPASLLDSDWFSANRAFTAYIRELTPFDDPSSYSSSLANCVYAKVGHVDILIDAGYNPSKDNGYRHFSKRIKELCNDGILDYVVLTTAKPECFSELLGSLKTNDGIIGDPEIKKIGVLIDPKYSKEETNNNKNALVNSYRNLVTKYVSSGKIGVHYDSLAAMGTTYSFGNVGSLSILQNDYTNVENSTGDVGDNSLAVYLSIGGVTYLNVGLQHNPDKLKGLVSSNSALLSSKINVFQIPWNGYVTSDDDLVGYKEFISSIAATTTFRMMLAGTCNEFRNNGSYPSDSFYKEIIHAKSSLFTYIFANLYFEKGSRVAPAAGELEAYIRSGWFGEEKKRKQQRISMRGSAFYHPASSNLENSYGLDSGSKTSEDSDSYLRFLYYV